MRLIKNIISRFMAWTWRLGDDVKRQNQKYPDTTFLGLGGLTREEMQERIDQADRLLYGKAKIKKTKKV